MNREIKYPIGGYAPGSYSCKCVNCETRFIGDKRAVQCEACAMKSLEWTRESCECKSSSWDRDAGCFVCDDCGKRI